jgi:Tol biopolymer transport system component
VVKSTGGRGGHLSWSPDGSSILYTGMTFGAITENIFMIDAKTSKETQITRYDENEMARGYYYPIWFPDGSKIISLFGDEFGNYDFYEMNADGSNQVKLANVTFDFIAVIWPD